MRTSVSIVGIGLVVLSACEGGTTGTAASEVSAQSGVFAVKPVTPDVGDLPSTLVDGVREFRVKAQVFQQQLETMPLQSAEVWGYNGSTPGPTAIAYEGERIRFVVTNELPEPTTVHFHGMHEPNEADGVAGVERSRCAAEVTSEE